MRNKINAKPKEAMMITKDFWYHGTKLKIKHPRWWYVWHRGTNKKTLIWDTTFPMILTVSKKSYCPRCCYEVSKDGYRTMHLGKDSAGLLKWYLECLQEKTRELNGVIERGRDEKS